MGKIVLTVYVFGLLISWSRKNIHGFAKPRPLILRLKGYEALELSNLIFCKINRFSLALQELIY